MRRVEWCQMRRVKEVLNFAPGRRRRSSENSTSRRNRHHVLQFISWIFRPYPVCLLQLSLKILFFCVCSRITGLLSQILIWSPFWEPCSTFVQLQQASQKHVLHEDRMNTRSASCSIRNSVTWTTSSKFRWAGQVIVSMTLVGNN